MKVIRADAMGLCFGVRDALRYIERIPHPDRITVYGDLVHNGKINQRLVQLGFHRLEENGRETRRPETPAVLITAHGVSDRERGRLGDAGYEIHDTTCPLVRRAHRAAMALDADGCFVLLIGRHGHVEARGLVGDLRHAEIVESPAEVRAYAFDKIGVICQTTTPDSLALAVLKQVYALNPGKDIRYVDTVCAPTRERQRALDRLLPQVDALVVVGGRKSRNSRELAEKAAARGVRAVLVDGAAELDPAWFEGCEAVGLTAGTSTLDASIEEVYRALVCLDVPRQSREAHEVQEVMATL